MFFTKPHNNLFDLIVNFQVKFLNKKFIESDACHQFYYSDDDIDFKIKPLFLNPVIKKESINGYSQIFCHWDNLKIDFYDLPFDKVDFFFNGDSQEAKGKTGVLFLEQVDDYIYCNFGYKYDKDYVENIDIRFIINKKTGDVLTSSPSGFTDNETILSLHYLVVTGFASMLDLIYKENERIVGKTVFLKKSNSNKKNKSKTHTVYINKIKRIHVVADLKQVSSGRGKRKEPHERRKHIRRYKNGKEVNVKSAKIHGGSDEIKKYKIKNS